MAVSYKRIIGVDEVGRGPLAGPLAVAAVLLSQTKNSKLKTGNLLMGIKDSKRLTPRQREEWFVKLKICRDKGSIDWEVSFVNPKSIDRIGITRATASAVNRCLRKLDVNPKQCLVLLDGRLRAPSRFKYQKTIIRGDEKRRVIAAASVIAKVCRDRRMCYYSRLFPEYGFDRHKGYGTMAHYEALGKYGRCSLHRHSFM